MIKIVRRGDARGSVFALDPAIEPHAGDGKAEARTAPRLRAMVEAHWVSLGRILRTLGVPDAEIEDALQQVYLVAADKLEAIVVGKERAFLTQVAVHIAARVRRRRAKSRETATDDVDVVAELDDARRAGADEAIDRDRALRLAVLALESMAEDTRTVFVLHEIEEMTMSEIATVLDVPPGTVASRLRRGREEFSAITARMRRDLRGKR